MDTSSIASVVNFSSLSALAGAYTAGPKALGPHRHHGHAEAAQNASAPGADTPTLRYQRSERAGLYIVTQEGDVVALRIKVRDSVAATSTESTGDGTQVGELAIAARSSMKISFHVEGDLNAAELAAIGHVVDQVGALADQFFAGDVPAAFAAAQNFDIDGSQLAKVGLRLAVRESVTYSGPMPLAAATTPPAATPSQTPAVPTSPAETPADSSADAGASAAAAADTASTAAADAESTAAAPEAPVAPAEAPPPAAPATAVGSAVATIAGFLHQLLGALGTQPTPAGSGSQVSLSMSLKLQLFAATVAQVAIAAPPAISSASADGQQLVGDTLDALAAAHDAPLSTNA
jgi:hypothetical protein